MIGVGTPHHRSGLATTRLHVTGLSQEGLGPRARHDNRAHAGISEQDLLYRLGQIAATNSRASGRLIAMRTSLTMVFIFALSVGLQQM